MRALSPQTVHPARARAATAAARTAPRGAVTRAFLAAAWVAGVSRRRLGKTFRPSVALGGGRGPNGRTSRCGATEWPLKRARGPPHRRVSLDCSAAAMGLCPDSASCYHQACLDRYLKSLVSKNKCAWLWAAPGPRHAR